MRRARGPTASLGLCSVVLLPLQGRPSSPSSGRGPAPHTRAPPPLAAAPPPHTRAPPPHCMQPRPLTLRPRPSHSGPSSSRRGPASSHQSPAPTAAAPSSWPRPSPQPRPSPPQALVRRFLQNSQQVQHLRLSFAFLPGCELAPSTASQGPVTPLGSSRGHRLPSSGRSYPAHAATCVLQVTLRTSVEAFLEQMPELRAAGGGWSQVIIADTCCGLLRPAHFCKDLLTLRLAHDPAGTQTPTVPPPRCGWGQGGRGRGSTAPEMDTDGGFE